VQVVHMDKPHQDKPPKMPTENYNYHHKLVNEWRTDLKPLNVDQPEGPSFQVPSYLLGHHCRKLHYLLFCFCPSAEVHGSHIVVCLST